jgi:hypothetical protein
LASLPSGRKEYIDDAEINRLATLVSGALCVFIEVLLMKKQMNRAKGRRTFISPERRRELSAKDAVYVITCGIKGCPCKQENDRCERGFFSLFIQAIYGIDFATKNNLPYCIDFSKRIYCYSDPSIADISFWNFYFDQPLPRMPEHAVPVINDFFELYPLTIWNRGHLRKMNSHIRQLTFKEDVWQYIKRALRPLIGANVLGVHIRRTDHPAAIRPVRLKRYFRAVDKLIIGYDKLFLSTDDAKVVELFHQRYGNKLHTNDVTRSSDAVSVHRNTALQNRWRLGVDVLVDCYCLASCRRLILSYSNVSYAAMLFNPELPYTLLERPGTSWKRLKTLVVYFLDKWGIRKW